QGVVDGGPPRPSGRGRGIGRRRDACERWPSARPGCESAHPRGYEAVLLRCRTRGGAVDLWTAPPMAQWPAEYAPGHPRLRPARDLVVWIRTDPVTRRNENRGYVLGQGCGVSAPTIVRNPARPESLP